MARSAYRFFDTVAGGHFFTTMAVERRAPAGAGFLG